MTGRLIVVAGPSGSGKTTIAQALLAGNPSLEFSVSATTRARRPTEEDGKDYFFLSREEFVGRVEAGEFVEWEEVFGNFYGTLRAEVERALRAGRHMVFDIDVKGALSIKRHFPEALLLFILPPDRKVLEERLRARHTEDEMMLARRLERATMELACASQFDRCIVNDDRERAIREAQDIVTHYLSTVE